jgi:hypothetical protein
MLSCPSLFPSLIVQLVSFVGLHLSQLSMLKRIFD